MKRTAALRLITPFALAAAAATAGSACASGGGRHPMRAPRTYVDSEVVQVEVRSNYIGSLDLYIVSEGVASRFGDIDGPTTQRFVVDPSYYDLNDIRIVAVPIGGYGRASSGQLNIRRGNTVIFTIAPVLRQSSVLIR